MRKDLKKKLLKLLATIVLLPYALAVVYLVVPPVSTPMLADFLALDPPARRWVSLKNISPHLKAAVIASEDGAFCDHFGFDFHQIEKSVDAAMDGEKLRGASTITQQTAKNLFLWNGRSWLRKILEAPLTLWLELIWPKRRILEAYLNVAEWGDGIYGAEAAAQKYFNIPARALSPRQAAWLASMLPHPGRADGAQAAIIERRASQADLSCLK